MSEAVSPESTGPSLARVPPAGRRAGLALPDLSGLQGGWKSRSCGISPFFNCRSQSCNKPGAGYGLSIEINTRPSMRDACEEDRFHGAGCAWRGEVTDISQGVLEPTFYQKALSVGGRQSWSSANQEQGSSFQNGCWAVLIHRPW